jgi:hypothetical protein
MSCAYLLRNIGGDNLHPPPTLPLHESAIVPGVRHGGTVGRGKRGSHGGSCGGTGRGMSTIETTPKFGLRNTENYRCTTHTLNRWAGSVLQSESSPPPGNRYALPIRRPCPVPRARSEPAARCPPQTAQNRFALPLQSAPLLPRRISAPGGRGAGRSRDLSTPAKSFFFRFFDAGRNFHSKFWTGEEGVWRRAPV